LPLSYSLFLFSFAARKRGKNSLDLTPDKLRGTRAHTRAYARTRTGMILCYVVAKSLLQRALWPRRRSGCSRPKWRRTLKRPKDRDTEGNMTHHKQYDSCPLPTYPPSRSSPSGCGKGKDMWVGIRVHST